MRRSLFLRFLLALLLLVGAVALVPAPAAEGRKRTWETLIQPLAIGREVVRGYVLGQPRRGEEHDIVMAARSAATDAAIEIHVLDRGRWTGVRETASFGVAYETPRSASDAADCEAVTEAVAQAIRANDPGGLGPVDAIALRSDPPAPVISRTLDGLTGARGVALGACLVGFTWILATLPGGSWGVAAWLFALGLLLRVPHLGLPFVHDQDVQRVFTGHLPLSEILFGLGLKDRHPPLYFVVLHAAQIFGQSESVVRMPAVLAGSLIGPAIVWGGRSLGRRVDVAALAGLAAALSVELIGRSREVSSIPLFACLAIVASVSLVKHTEAPSRRWAVALAASVGLALWTYYLAPFLLLGCVGGWLLSRRRLPAGAPIGLKGGARAGLRALGIGILAGSPALVLAVVTFFRDRSARVTAGEHPALAWGERGAAETARLLGGLTTSTLGSALVVVLLLVLAIALWKRDAAALVPLGGLVASFLAIFFLAPVARVQPYYLTAVLPLGLLAVAAGRNGVSPRPALRGWPFPAALGACCALLVPGLAGARTLYIPDADAFMPGFAEAAAKSPERRIVTVAHYDATLLSYYLARKAGAPMDWTLALPEGDGEGRRLTGLDKVVDSLVRSHALPKDPDGAAIEKLRRLLQREPVLVIERDAFRLPRLGRELRSCTLLAEAGTGRLYRCASRHAP